ncbi:hypothetical protein Ddc_03626 [Ditylenchus destructor]|nr:hypothetical protein Ddc_03626 [Ditylenchus destructor]
MIESVSADEDFDLMLLDEVSEGECSDTNISDVSQEDLQTPSSSCKKHSISKKDCHSSTDPSSCIAKHPRIRPVSRSPSPPPSLINVMKQGISVLEKAFWTGRTEDGQNRNISGNECSVNTLRHSQDRRIYYDRDKVNKFLNLNEGVLRNLVTEVEITLPSHLTPEILQRGHIPRPVILAEYVIEIEIPEKEILVEVRGKDLMRPMTQSALDVRDQNLRITAPLLQESHKSAMKIIHFTSLPYHNDVTQYRQFLKVGHENTDPFPRG